ncbi:hypothetical protein L873DRAFT_944512 [Choiromyces venosus 120613-1]|uniref:Uncharacterized protein n=1 Tax=Choiromyces venosus 120613-1 TaxID=1336337 RepID=A0A3N4K411_9PEZI|nr:hypothetical protein L873DRAFT_944512 [Choiromyces venosus 120613-1]
MGRFGASVQIHSTTSRVPLVLFLFPLFYFLLFSFTVPVFYFIFTPLPTPCPPCFLFFTWSHGVPAGPCCWSVWIGSNKPFRNTQLCWLSLARFVRGTNQVEINVGGAVLRYRNCEDCSASAFAVSQLSILCSLAASDLLHRRSNIPQSCIIPYQNVHPSPVSLEIPVIFTSIIPESEYSIRPSTNSLILPF